MLDARSTARSVVYRRCYRTERIPRDLRALFRPKAAEKRELVVIRGKIYDLDGVRPERKIGRIRLALLNVDPSGQCEVSDLSERADPDVWRIKWSAAAKRRQGRTGQPSLTSMGNCCSGAARGCWTSAWQAATRWALIARRSYNAPEATRSYASLVKPPDAVGP